jgi:hypothetical protein
MNITKLFINIIVAYASFLLLIFVIVHFIVEGKDKIVLFFSLKKERSTLKEKNLHWKSFHIYDYNSRVDSIIKYFIEHKEKVSCSLAHANTCYMQIYTKNRVLYVWVENKWSGYASNVWICKTDSIQDYLYPILTIESCRPSYHTMCQLIELEKQC